MCLLLLLFTAKHLVICKRRKHANTESSNSNFFYAANAAVSYLLWLKADFSVAMAVTY